MRTKQAIALHSPVYDWSRNRERGVGSTSQDMIHLQAASDPGSRQLARTLGGACLAHLVHDGLTDLIYVLLPVWQKQFGLDFAALAMLRCLYAGTMGGLQVPADSWTRPVSGRLALVGATGMAAFGFFVEGLPGGLSTLCVGLVLAGLGSSVQHPRASLLVSEVYGAGARRPLGLYNFAGDLGKSVFPPTVALLLLVLPWRGVVVAIGLIALASAVAIAAVLPRVPVVAGPLTEPQAAASSRSGFGFLLVAGVLDTATRMGFLLFLPSLIEAKGGSETEIGIGFAMLFGGGAFGKAACGWLGDRFGLVSCVVATELATFLLMVAVLLSPRDAALALLPFLGVVINGTSSVLYGSVPELAPTEDVGRAFAIFYTGVIGSGAVAPILFGVVGDYAGHAAGALASGLAALGTIPAVLAIQKRAWRA